MAGYLNQLRLLAIGVLLPALVGCTGKAKDNDGEQKSYDFPDTLRVATLYGPMSFFEYRGDTLGYDYSLIKQLTADKNITAEFILPASLSEAVEMLDSGLVDVIAYDVPVTAEYLEDIVPCAYEHLSSQILVQKKGPDALTDVTELIDKDVYVEKDSKFSYRLSNLNNELGGGINIIEIEEDSLMPVDLLQKVSKGEMQFTVVDSETAQLNKSYYRDLDLTLELSFPQRSAWAVSNREQWLADSINAWYEGAGSQQANKKLLRRYFELSRIPKFDIRSFEKNFGSGHISPYDDLFKKYGKQAGVDWRLLAAIAFAESKFKNEAESWAGARGIMQIMPSTARGRGVDPETLINPEVSIKLASQMVTSLDKSFLKDVPDPVERRKFIMAAYNSGIAHIRDAISIAKGTGLDSTKWADNVAIALRMKSQPEIYNNKELCKYGYFKGTYTTAYVQKVEALYQKAVDSFPE